MEKLVSVVATRKELVSRFRDEMNSVCRVLTGSIDSCVKEMTTKWSRSYVIKKAVRNGNERVFVLCRVGNLDKKLYAFLDSSMSGLRCDGRDETIWIANDEQYIELGRDIEELIGMIIERESKIISDVLDGVKLMGRLNVKAI